MRASTGSPLVIGHRGACGYTPEHTLASYALAARMGADYLEPDLVPTRDGVLVARHENRIDDTTDVAERPELADRRTTKVVDGVEVSGWFTEDLTLAELRTLRARERLPHVRPANTGHDGAFPVPTLEEILQLREELSTELGREVGLYPETKHPSYFAGLGLALEPPLVAALRAHGLDRPDAPVLVQSFELDNLARLREDLLLRTPTVFLLAPSGSPVDSVRAGDGRRDFGWYAGRDGLAELVAAGVTAVGPELTMVLAAGPEGELGPDTGLVARAHDTGLAVHPYTFRAENLYLYADFRRGADPLEHGDLQGQVLAFLELGVDGFFTDHPDVGAGAVASFRAGAPDGPGGDPRRP